MPNSFLRIERKFILFLLARIGSLGNSATKRLFKINDKLTPARYKDLLEKILASKGDLLAKAKKYREIPSLSDMEKEVVYYYFLIKHLIAEHEARSVKIPLQVFNEHRMALDHFIRAKIGNSESNTDKL